MLDKFRARPAADDPAVVAKHEARQLLSEAREVRTAEREAARIAQKSRDTAERSARATAEFVPFAAQTLVDVQSFLSPCPPAASEPYDRDLDG
jgi:Family of unknown function (DUF6481)